MSLADIARLGWWLGPRAAAPAPAVERARITVPGDADGPPFDTWVFTPRRRAPDGVLLLIQGLHPDGPADPRMTRFASVLAHAGLCVVAPFMPDLRSLKLSPALMPDARRAFEVADARAAALRRPVDPGVMSISFGSLPALRLAGHPDCRSRVGGVLTFGGYARWQVALRFALSGGDGVPFDPLNRPAGYMQLLDALPPLADQPRVEAAWRGFVDETWGRPEMKADDRWRPVAERWAGTVHPDDRAIARLGLGVDDRCAAFAAGIIEAKLADEGLAWLDPRPAIPRIAAPIYIAHGVDDDVIPVGQAAELAEVSGGRAKVLLTGAFGHTGPVHAKRGVRALVQEARSTVGILRALRSIATRPRSAEAAGADHRVDP